MIPKEAKQHPKFTKYYITKDGKVWSKLSKRFLRSFKILDGHLQINLGNKNRHKSVHRLVLETYIGMCPNSMVCRHLNGIPDDNRLKNLKWDIPSNNVLDTYKHGRIKTIGEKHGQSKLTEQNIKTIRFIDSLRLFSRKQIGKMFHVSAGCIQSIIMGYTWTHIKG